MGIIAALTLCDYAQLRLSHSFGNAKLADVSLRFGRTAATVARSTAAGLVPVRLRPGLDNPLKKFHNDLRTREGPQMHKWDQYFDVYQRYFQRFVGNEVGCLVDAVHSPWVACKAIAWLHGCGVQTYGSLSLDANA
jgi:hypothetical protein